MFRIRNYISRTVSTAILMVLLLVISLDAIFSIVDELGKLNDSYDFFHALNYVLLTLPGAFVNYSPLATLIGCLIGMGTLASNSELTVMRACGASVARLVLYATRPVILVIIAAFLVSEFVAPHTDRWSKTYRDLHRWGIDLSIVTNGGFWHREDHTFMHFNVVEPGGVLHGLLFLEFDDGNQLVRATTAKRAGYYAKRWTLEEVNETTFSDGRVESAYYRFDQWETTIEPTNLAFLVSEPSDLAPSKLYRYTNYLDEQGLDNAPYRLAFWQKCLQPIAMLSLVVVALSFIFGPLRSVTMGFRIFIGVIIGICFQFAQNLLGPSSIIYGFSPLIAVCFPIFVCFFVGGILLIKAR